MTRTELENYREALKAALYSGELMVRDSDGKQTTYRSVAEMQRALARLEAELNGLDEKRRPRSFRINVSKGTSC